VSKITSELADCIAALQPDDRKMLVINDRYYCQLVPREGKIFSDLRKDESSPAKFQSAEARVLDMAIGEGHHAVSNGTIWHQVNDDLLSKDHFSLMFHDQHGDVLLNAVDIEVVDEPYDLRKLIDKLHRKPVHEVTDPIASLEGVSFIDFGEKDGAAASLEYYISGNVYFEVVDFSGLDEMSIVSLKSPRRDVVVEYTKLAEDNVDEIAAKINAALDKLFGN